MTPCAFDAVATEYDGWYSTPLGATVDRLESDLILRMAAPRPGERALDVGTGTGHWAGRLAALGLSVSGVDASAPMLAVARGKGLSVSLAQAPAEQLPFDDAAFDLVTCITALEFARDRAAALAEMGRVCRPGGRIVVGALNAWSPWAWVRRRAARRQPGDPFAAAHFYAPRELVSQLAGLGRVSWGSSVFVLPSGAGLSRADALERFGRGVLRPFGALLVARVDR